ncbi:HEPN domain-containing protein [Oceanicaulis sp.]|uniref:HEPN domain-containing protein n=1 Tax=Oceanicaulis sp. TaxID=1924941 RepID=UPI003BAD7C58
MSGAYTAFQDQLKLIDQLIAIHGKLQKGRGRRHEQDAIHRAGVVLTVAAWQAYNEKVLLEAVEKIDAAMRDPHAGTPAWVVQSFSLRRAQIESTVKKFNTPDDVRVRDLFNQTIGLNPWPHWEWKRGPRQWDSKEVRKRTNTWVLVRHSIAHGFELPNDVDWLQGTSGNPRLTLSLLKECRAHFIHIVDLMDAIVGNHLKSTYNMASPW